MKGNFFTFVLEFLPIELYSFLLASAHESFQVSIMVAAACAVNKDVVCNAFHSKETCYLLMEPSLEYLTGETKTKGQTRPPATPVRRCKGCQYA